ncbi:MAG: LysM peptidoglycan-binding domain-containing protein, partial [Anaerolineae bacterium]|nr:LysM peptidoglycan-binding domain-containing protein [Anaerolineae bacterium]
MNKLKQLTIVLLLLAVTFGLIPAPIMAQEGAACDADVIVQGDDWLSKIADKFLGDPLAFPAIVEATNTAAAADESYAQIDNPDIIEIGWKLCIPAAEAAQ